jgi:tripartite-type tricarboxylate transporter receptor subunit TctC
MKRVGTFLLVLLIICPVVFAAGTSEQPSGSASDGLGDYPNKPIQCIVPYAPGGGTDAFSRTVIKYMNIKQPIVVVNVEGASGMIGAMQAYNTPNDGYNILAHNPLDVVSFTLSGQTPINLWSEFETICFAVTDYNMVSTNKETGWKTIEEVVAYAKAHPKEIKWSTTGARTVNMIDTTKIIAELGLTDYVTVVPYDNGSAARTALMGNHIQVSNSSISDMRSIIESGDCIPLMVLSEQRSQLLPDVPTTRERGVSPVTASVPRGFYAPKGMPAAQIKYLADAMKIAVEKPEFAQDMIKLGIEARFVDRETGYKTIAEAVQNLAPYFEAFNKN